MKVVYNADYGGFSLPPKALERFVELKGEVPRYVEDIDRADPALVKVVEELKPGSLAIEDVPAGSVYRIHEYDGLEHIALIQDHEWHVAH